MTVGGAGPRWRLSDAAGEADRRARTSKDACRACFIPFLPIAHRFSGGIVLCLWQVPRGRHNRGRWDGSAVPGGLVEDDRKPTAKAVGYWRSRKASQVSPTGSYDRRRRWASLATVGCCRRGGPSRPGHTRMRVVLVSFRFCRFSGGIVSHRWHSKCSPVEAMACLPGR
jgi:hypothetical protein